MGKKTEFLYLSESDMIKAGVLDSARCVDVADEVFRLVGKGDYIMGGINKNQHGFSLYFPEESIFPNMPTAGPDRRFMAMTAYLGGKFNVCGAKWYGSNIKNPSRGLPRSVLMIILNDPDTCEPLCILSANLLSAIRTGGVAGLGARYLMRKDANICTIIGAGPINKACFQAIATQAKKLTQVIIYDLLTEKAKDFAKWCENNFNITASVAYSLEKATKAGDIVSIAASRIKPVKLKNDWLKKGSLMIMTGRTQVDHTFWANSKLILDNGKMHEAYMKEAVDSGDKQASYKSMLAGDIYQMIDKGILPPIEQICNLGDIILGNQFGRENDEERITMVNNGMAVMDVGWSYEIYSNAKSMGLGHMLTLWDEPRWL